MGILEKHAAYFEQNRKLYNTLAPIHARSKLYNLDSLKAGASLLSDMEREEIGDVTGKTLLHLQCHFGVDTLSLARHGATVTGVDLADDSIRLAKELAEDCKLPARFITANIYDLPRVLGNEQFDVVYTSWGVICYLPDLVPWGQLIARYLKPGGRFYIAEFHPLMDTLDETKTKDGYHIKYPYFKGAEPVDKVIEDWADPSVTNTLHLWIHGLGSIITALASAGLRIDYLHEFSTVSASSWTEPLFPFLELSDDKKYWQIEKGRVPIPLLFSIMATKPASIGS